MMQKDARIKIKGKIAAFFFFPFNLDYSSKALFSSKCEGNLELWGVERKECKIGTFSYDWNG